MLCMTVQVSKESGRYSGNICVLITKILWFQPLSMFQILSALKAFKDNCYRFIIHSCMRGQEGKVFFCLGISIICPTEYIHLSQTQTHTHTHTHARKQTHVRYWLTDTSLISVNKITSHSKISFWHNSQPWNKLIGPHIYLGGDQRSCQGSALSSKNLWFRLKRSLLLSICQLLPSDSHCGASFC